MAQQNKQNQRANELGFEPQHEISYNQLLPYADVIDKESCQAYAKIKENLTKSVLQKDIRLGTIFWSGQLSRYIRFYGYKFPKADHIYFVKLLYSLLDIKDIEIPLIDNLISVISILIKKRHLIKHGEDLILDWNVVYKLLHRLLYSKEANMDLLVVPQSTQNKVRNFVKTCRVYFDVKATKAMLDEWRPLFCPYDMTMTNAATYIELFLPTLAYTKVEREQSWMLWKDEFLQWWLSVKNGPSWERRFILLFARLASQNIGYIDWSDYVTPLFTRILRSFQLPVGKLQLTSALSDKIPMESGCQWLVSMLGTPNTSCLVIDHFVKLLKSIETFFHPSNHGSWVNTISNFVYHFLNKMLWRVFHERYDTQVWMPYVPEVDQIRDAEIEAVITAVKPAAFMLLYNKKAFPLNLHILQVMNMLRPDLVMPQLMEKTFVASDCLTEPFHFRACLSALSNMLFPSVRRFPKIRKHIIPLLIGCLPGIDPNDLPKTVSTFKLINTCMVLVPMIDCSQAVASHSNLTPSEHELCMATTQFEDFVAQFFDRCLLLIENLKHDGNNSSEQQPMLQMESAFKNFIIASTGIVLHQSAPEIVTARLRGLFRYSTTHLFEGKPALLTFAGIVGSCAKVNPAEAYSMFLPHYCQSIIDYCNDNPEPAPDHKLDKQFTWDMKILIELMNVGMIELLSYKELLFQVVDAVLKLKVKEAYKSAGSLLSGMINSWLTFYINDRKNLNPSEEQHKIGYLAINDWGKIMTPSEVKLNWHIATEEEFEAAFEAIERFLIPTLEKLQQFAESTPGGEGDLKKDEIQNYLHLAHDLISAIAYILPFEDAQWTDHRYESPVDFSTWDPVIFQSLSCYETCMDRNDRRTLRVRFFRHIQATLNKLLKDREDDVDAIMIIVSIYGLCSHFQENSKPYYNDHWKFYSSYKSSVADFMKPKKSRERSLILERALLQQEMRMVSSDRIRYTPMMHSIMLDLINLSVSRYAKVRSSAQSSFFSGLSTFPLYVYKSYLPIILSYLDPANEPTHNEHKGALYLLLGKSKSRMFLAFYLRWEVMAQVWPAILKAPHSDKPSIQKLSTKLIRKLSHYYVTIAIENVVPRASLDLAAQHMRSAGQFSEKEITSFMDEGAKHELTRNTIRLALYHRLVDDIVELRNAHDLTWRLNEASLDMLLDLVRVEVPISPKAIELFAVCLCDESVGVREIAVNSVAVLMNPMKRKHSVIMRTLQELNIKAAVPRTAGHRPDNEWLTYKVDEKLDTKEKYESAAFYDKTYLGYYAWPNTIKMYAPFSKQPKLARSRSELTESETAVYDVFTNQEFVDQFVDYLCLEREKGKSNFCFKHVELFRGLFRNFGDTFLPFFKPHIERMVAEKQESFQRCAAELIAGIVAGSKHWYFEMIDELRQWLIPLLRTAILNISSETLKDWDMSFQEMVRDRDPRRIYWILDFLVDELQSPSPSALVSSSRLALISGTYGQQQWRVPDLLFKVVSFLEGQLDHPYKNIRSKMGSVLSMAFLHELSLQGNAPLVFNNPSLDDIIRSHIFKIEPLLREGALASVSNATQLNISQLDINKEVLKSSQSVPMVISQDSLVGGPIPISAADSNLNQAQSQSFYRGLNMPANSVSGTSVLSQSRSNLTMARDAFSTTSTSSMMAGPVSSDERHRAIRVFKTFMKVIVNSQRLSLQPFHSSYVELLPYLCRLYPTARQHTSASSDDELNMDARLCMSCLAQSLLEPDQLHMLVEKIENVAASSSWHMRVCLLPYIQVFVFVNLFVIRHHEELLDTVRLIVMRLLEDERYEVAQMAGVTLSGMIGCGLIAINEELMNIADSLCGARLGKKARRRSQRSGSTPRASIDGGSATRSSVDAGISQRDLHRRHAGVLILSSCILSSPYTVPEWMPSIVMRLSHHLHEPQPIQATVKHTFSEFRRTHHDNWHEDKYKFTSDERVVLTDLLVSPNYYA